MKLGKIAAAFAGTLFMTAASIAHAETELVIATVNNGHMVEMQKHTDAFEKANPDIKLKWVTLEEGVLRSRVTTDIATKGGQFDIMTIGMYEAPIWGKKGWLTELNFSDDYAVDDIFPAVRKGLSAEGKLYAAPFYGESSMIMYRGDLVEKAGLNMPNTPTWDDVEKIVKGIHNPDEGVYGICLRGKPGWGDNMAFITTLANSYGAQWFGEDWKPQLDSPEWEAAVTFYVDLLTKYGPPGSANNSFNEILALINEGKCGMWIDATIAASFVSDPDQSKVADVIKFAQAPSKKTAKGKNWLWAWSLAVPASSKKTAEAMKFLEWATSKDYVNYIGENVGWGKVPTGTRASTYENPKFLEAAKFASAELEAIQSANPEDSTFNKSPYVGVQFAAIPEFQSIGVAVGQQMSSALAGKVTVKEALAKSQTAADRTMKKAKYY
ncbi:sugar ABC transporter substrate-binding protein [Cocleimonas flava]|uniref:Sorbitol-binding protein /mannitol-binding protein n=1 Tax=Cocleimonas flava TaxID=634765 RepID=A0A4R1EPH0_9GAMM|nr:sugar ABC transporter substrate-binding protein [Cocleimonas flava]TCJ83187.1 sorbitol-binding protein /mannitol-binding protein [Cocleimonas flava]